MRRLLTSWMSCGSALLALSFTLGCAPADKPVPSPEQTTPADKPEDMEESTTETPSTEGDVEDATPVEDAAEERKDEAEAAGTDPLDTTSDDPNVKLGEPEDPVNLK